MNTRTSSRSTSSSRQLILSPFSMYLPLATTRDQVVFIDVSAVNASSRPAWYRHVTPHLPPHLEKVNYVGSAPVESTIKLEQERSVSQSQGASRCTTRSSHIGPQHSNVPQPTMSCSDRCSRLTRLAARSATSGKTCLVTF